MMSVAVAKTFWHAEHNQFLEYSKWYFEGESKEKRK